MVKRLVTRNMVQTRWKKSATNWEPLSETRESGVPYLNTQSLTKAIATSSVLMRLSGVTCVNFEKRSVITRRNLYPAFDVGSGPKMPIATHFSGFVGGNRRITVQQVRLDFCYYYVKLRIAVSRIIVSTNLHFAYYNRNSA